MVNVCTFELMTCTVLPWIAQDKEQKVNVLSILSNYWTFKLK